MSFSSLAKEELLRLPLGKNCCVMSELSALVQTSGSLQLRGGGRVRVTFRVESAGLARRIFRLLGAGLELTPRLHFVQHARLGGRRSCVLTLEDEAAQKLLDDGQITTQAGFKAGLEAAGKAAGGRAIEFTGCEVHYFEQSR